MRASNTKTNKVSGQAQSTGGCLAYWLGYIIVRVATELGIHKSVSVHSICKMKSQLLGKQTRSI